MKKKLSFFVIIVVLLSCISGVCFFLTTKLNFSYIYKTVTEYQSKNSNRIDTTETPFAEDSAEQSFLKGLNCYAHNAIKEAEALFEESQKQEYKDVALPAYLNFYMNECKNIQIGQGDPDLVKNFLDAIQYEPKLANDTELIWKMTSTILGDIHSRQTAIDLLNEYLTQTPQLKLVTILTIKGNIGMLYMSNEDYGDSIYVFHEIIAKAEKIKNPDVRARLKIQSYEYLGNMYAELSDEKAAINEYNRAINEVVEDPKINAACKYGSYINKVESYIQLKNYSKALEASMEIDEIIPNLTPEIATGVEIFKNKNLAIIKSHQEKFEEAQQHLQICGELLEKDNNSAFLDSEMYVKFAYYEFLIENNQTSLAIEELNTLLSQSANQGMGFNNHIYTLLAKLYRKTGQMNEYMKVSAKIHKNEDHFNDTLKKDYLKYVEESFNLNQLREKEKLYQNGIILLLGIILVCVLVGAIAIIFLTKSRRNNLKDALTGIYNRKYLTVFIKKNLKTSSNMTIIMGDIDYFKNYNDTYGHPAGDVAIQAVAELLKESIRGNDKLIRYGGEEFLILMENIDLEGIDKVCKRIIRNTQEKHIVHEDSKAAKYLTLSLGVAQKVVKNELDLKQGIEEADQALYRAKQNGRNQYIIYHSDEL